MINRKAMGKNNRAKGHKLERDVVNDFKAMGCKDAMTSRAGDRSKDNQKIDILNVPINIQCKSTIKCVNYVNLIAEMPQPPENRVMNVVFNRIKNKGEYVILQKDAFMSLMRMFINR